MKAPPTKPIYNFQHDEELRREQLSEVRTSVRQRWSLVEKSPHTNKGFEMEEINKTELTQSYMNDEDDESSSGKGGDMYYSSDDRNMDENRYTVPADGDTKNTDENQYNEIVTESVKQESIKQEPEETSKIVGYKVNEHDSNTSSTASLHEKDDSGSFDDHVKFRDEDDTEVVKRRNPVTKKNSKVWKREFEKQPQWQNFVMEFSKRLSEVNSDKGKTSINANPMKGKNILRPSSRPVSFQAPKTPEPEIEIRKQKERLKPTKQDHTRVSEEPEKQKEQQAQPEEAPPVYEDTVSQDIKVNMEPSGRDDYEELHQPNPSGAVEGG